MKQDGRIYLRTNAETKAKMDRLCAQQGVELSGIVNAFLEDCIKKNALPSSYVKQCQGKRKRRTRLLTISQIRDGVLSVLKGYSEDEIQAVYLFGSYSRGKATAKSDVDLLIIPGTNLSFPRLGEFNENMREVLDKEVDTLVSDEGVDPRVLKNIDHDKRLLYSRAKNGAKD
jgi:predicted nucleotidyltransferase